MDANTSSVLFITCLQTQSPPHIGRLVLVEQPIPLLNEFFLFFSSVHLMTAPPLPLILPLFLPFPPLQLLRCFFLSFICFRFSSYTTSCPSFFFLIISSLIQPLFLSGSLVPLLLLHFPNRSLELGILFIILPLPHMLSNAFSLWRECKVHWFIDAFYFLLLSSGLSKGTSFQQEHPKTSWDAHRFSEWETWEIFSCSFYF